MSQGKEYTAEEREIILESLREYLELGFSRSRACKMIGFNETTLCKWLSNNEALSMKISGWENAMNKIALANIRDAMNKEGELENDIRKENSWKWAERKMKDEFSERKELTGEGGKDLIPQERKEQIEEALKDL